MKPSRHSIDHILLTGYIANLEEKKLAEIAEAPELNGALEHLITRVGLPVEVQDALNRKRFKSERAWRYVTAPTVLARIREKPPQTASHRNPQNSRTIDAIPSAMAKRLRVRGRRDVSCFYNWVAPNHRGPELRRALGYADTSFRRALAALKIRPSAPSKAGRTGFMYSGKSALSLLDFRLERQAPARAQRQATAIWSYDKLQYQGAPGFSRVQEICRKYGVDTSDHRPEITGWESLK